MTMVKWPLLKQFLLVTFLLLVATSISILFISRDVNIQAKLNEARSTADTFDHIGKWLSGHGGVWVRRPIIDEGKIGDFLKKEFTAPEAPRSSEGNDYQSVDAIAIYQKNPALAQREISDIAENSPSRVKFRMTSDKFMNPDNAPTRFELAALESIRSADSKEYWELRDGQLMYARGIIATAGCMSCHDTPEKAPAVVREKYPTRGYGYELGKVIGVTSVRLPLSNSLADMAQNISFISWVAISTLLLILGGLVMMVVFSMIRPINALKDFADRIIDGDLQGEIVDPALREEIIDPSSKNEIGALARSLSELRNGMKTLLKIRS